MYYDSCGQRNCLPGSQTKLKTTDNHDFGDKKKERKKEKKKIKEKLELLN